jgi:hypothetical protein
MLRGEPSNRRTNRIFWGILGFLAIVFVFSFRGEIAGVLKDIRELRQDPGPAGTPTITPTVTPTSPPQTPVPVTPTPTPTPDPGPLGSLIFVSFNCVFGFGFIFLLWVILVSFQALLPITNILQDPFQSLIDVYRTASRLMLHILEMHGPAIFIKDGVANNTKEDDKREGHGVIVVDFNSAVVLEERNPPPGINGLVNNLWLEALALAGLVNSKQSPRVCGPGIIFTRPRERIGGVVDLRKQFRLQANVPCYTRDGIELTTNVFAGFTIGQKPDILQVTYEGEFRPENLRVVTMERLPENHLRITGLLDELDEADRSEIHAFATGRRAASANGSRHEQPIYLRYTPPIDTNQQEFDGNRVFAAVVAKARKADQAELDWSELPTRVAAGLYRELLLTVNYDELYAVRDENRPFPLPGYKSQLRLNLRNNGILAYRLIFHKDYRRKGIVLRRNDVYRQEFVIVSQDRSLTNSKVLRDRGIKVIMSGFSDPTPVNKQVYQQRFESWRTAWSHEYEINMAEHELQAARMRSRAYAQAQQDLWQSLSMIFAQQMGEEALALRIFQTLDQAAADPKTQALLPGNAIDMMRHLSGLLLPPGNMPPVIPPPPVVKKTGEPT